MTVRLPDKAKETWYYNVVTRRGGRKSGWVEAHSRTGAKARVRHDVGDHIYEWDTLAVDE